MKILALEFSSAQRSVAILSGRVAPTPGPDRPLEVVQEVVETGTGPTGPLGMIERALAGVGMEPEEIERIALGLGPGSYTGVRAAISVAQGWQLARGVKLLGIGSAECVARQALANGLLGRVTVVIDAQRREFYVARYELSDGHCREQEPLRLAAEAEVRDRERAGELLIGPDVHRWFPSGRVVFPSAAFLAAMAVDRDNFVPAEKLEPIYLRAVQFVKAQPPRVLG